MSKLSQSCRAWAAALTLVAAPALAAPASGPLKIISIDVEGGAATLYVTPQGHSLLIDTGWPAGRGGRRAPGAPIPSSSAERIVAAAKSAGLSKLDYVLISHYHVDHSGGVPDLMARMPIGAFVDHGPNRESLPANPTPADIANDPIIFYNKYLTAIAGKKRIVLTPGQQLKLDGLTFTVINADRKMLAKPLPGAGGPGADCAATTSKTDDGGEENPRAVGVLARYGKTRILSLADTTWDMENRLVCPINTIGLVDLMFADNHGNEQANSPNLVNSVKPQVAIFNNGTGKGGDGETLDRYAHLPSDVWQLHFATRSPEKNMPADRIANVDGPDATNPLIISVDRGGSFTVTNTRNSFSKTYRAR